VIRNKPKRSFTIRTLLILTAVCAAALVYLWPLYDDSQFVDGFQQLENKSVRDAIEHCRFHTRELIFNENNRGGLLGLHAYSKDGHMIALGIEPIHANNRPIHGWQLDKLAEMPIQSINVYNLRAMRQHENNRFP
jgi:hypothetical protein